MLLLAYFFSDNYVYQVAQKIHWEDFLSPEQTLAVFANVTDSNISKESLRMCESRDVHLQVVSISEEIQEGLRNVG